VPNPLCLAGTAHVPADLRFEYWAGAKSAAPPSRVRFNSSSEGTHHDAERCGVLTGDEMREVSTPPVEFWTSTRSVIFVTL
jgi:hypothetical protein